MPGDVTVTVTLSTQGHTVVVDVVVVVGHTLQSPRSVTFIATPGGTPGVDALHT